jgi:ABC-type transport system involved in multi-copper enzyme maturation permease subunit
VKALLAPFHSPPVFAPKAAAALRLPVRGVIATIARQEAHRLIDSFRLPAVSILLLLLLVLPALTASAQHRSEREAHAAVIEDHAAALREVTIDDLAEVQHPALRLPWGLAFAVDGGQAATPDAYRQALSPLVAPELRRTQSGNRRVPGPAPLDWMFAIRVTLSLAAFLLAHDALCGERQGGTLKLLLSQPIPRWKILAGKLAALWVCLAAPLVLGFALSCGLLLVLGEVPIGGAELLKAGLVVLLGLWAVALFALTALVVSAATRSPATSLSVLALLWVGGVVVIPALGNLLAHRLSPVPAEGEIERRMLEVQQRIATEHAGREGRWRGPEWAAVDGYAWERASAQVEIERRRLQEEVRWWAAGRKLGQARLARSLASMSPPSLVQDLGERLTGSGSWRDRAFLYQARAFRAVLEDRVRRLDAADPASPHLLFFRGYLSRRPVPPREIPRFAFREIPVAEGLANAAPALALLGLETLVLALLAVFLFARQEPG